MFKKGDKVVCVDIDSLLKGGLTKGGVYLVDIYECGEFIDIINDNGMSVSYYASRFKMYESEENSVSITDSGKVKVVMYLDKKDDKLLKLECSILSYYHSDKLVHSNPLIKLDDVTLVYKDESKEILDNIQEIEKNIKQQQKLLDEMKAKLKQ